MSQERNIAGCLVVAGLLLAACGSADDSTGVKPTEMASACNTPELRQMYDTLMTGKEEARRALLEPLRVQPVDEVDPAVQRCVIEAFLDSKESGPLSREYRSSLKEEYGVYIPHHFYQPDYLPRLVADGPSSILVETYGHEVVPLLIQVGEKVDGKEFLRDASRLNTIERTLRFEAQSRLELSAEEHQQLEDLLDRWEEYDGMRKTHPVSNFYSTLWGAYTYDLDGGLARAGLAARACEILGQVGIPKQQQWEVVEDLVLLDPELARKFLDWYVEVEEGPQRDYMRELLGKSHGAETAWPTLSEPEALKLARSRGEDTYEPVCRTLLTTPAF